MLRRRRDGLGIMITHDQRTTYWQWTLCTNQTRGCSEEIILHYELGHYLQPRLLGQPEEELNEIDFTSGRVSELSFGDVHAYIQATRHNMEDCLSQHRSLERPLLIKRSLLPTSFFLNVFPCHAQHRNPKWPMLTPEFPVWIFMSERICMHILQHSARSSKSTATCTRVLLNIGRFKQTFGIFVNPSINASRPYLQQARFW